MGDVQPTKAGAILLGKPRPKAEMPEEALRDQTMKAGDKAAEVIGVHGAVQNGSQAAVKAAGGIDKANKAVATVARVADGDTLALSTAATALVRAFSHTQVGWAVRPVARFGSKALQFLGKGAMITGVATAIYDTAKASLERDPAKQDGAWATAGLTVAGMGLGLAGVASGLAPLGVACLVGSAAIGVFQLVDAYFCQNRGATWLGTRVVHPIRRALGVV
jgi:hypothetical protein